MNRDLRALRSHCLTLLRRRVLLGWQVSRAVSLATGEEVALKHVFPQRQARGGAPAPCALARELAVLQALRHPNILALRVVLPQARTLAVYRPPWEPAGPFDIASRLLLLADGCRRWANPKHMCAALLPSSLLRSSDRSALNCQPVLRRVTVMVPALSSSDRL